MAIKIFGLKLTDKEYKDVFQWKKLLIIGLGALAVNFVILAPFNFPWEGWNVVLSAIGGAIAGEWLD